MDNTSLFFQIFNLHGQSWVFDQLMVFGATHLIYITFAFVLFLALKGNMSDKKSFLLMLLMLPLAVLLVKIIHLFIYEPRPFVAFNFMPLVSENTDASFPSRHATIISVLAFSFTYYKSKWAALFLFLMFWIGISRIFIGVHYPLDVLGGFLVGAVSLSLALQIKKLIFKKFFKLS